MKQYRITTAEVGELGQSDSSCILSAEDQQLVKEIMGIHSTPNLLLRNQEQDIDNVQTED